MQTYTCINVHMFTFIYLFLNVYRKDLFQRVYEMESPFVPPSPENYHCPTMHVDGLSWKTNFSMMVNPITQCIQVHVYVPLVHIFHFKCTYSMHGIVPLHCF